jgi:hypothetical protein
MKRNSKRSKGAKKLLEELRKSIARRPNPFAGMSKEQAINYMRKIREKLWEEKIATRS